VHAAARELLTDPSYREAAGRLRAEAEALPDLDHAAGLLARLAAERRPGPVSTASRGSACRRTTTSGGRLTAIDVGIDIPIEVRRIFYVHGVVRDRGGHAHRTIDQVLIAVHGALTAFAYDGTTSRRYRLDDASRALYVPRMVFVELVDFSDGGVCLVLANTYYDRSASIRTLEEFDAEVAARRG
jgi:hypothetical protein